MQQTIRTVLQDSIAVKQAILEDPALLQTIQEATERMIAAFRADHKIWFCGNGGSASDAQHLAAELSGRFYYDRPPLFAEALQVNTSYLTAVANDYGYDMVFARMIEAKGRKGDILFALSTSGNSPNIVKALQYCKKNDITTIGLSGAEGGDMTSFCDILIKVPSTDTPRIQESHITIGHIICQMIESTLFPRQ